MTPEQKASELINKMYYTQSSPTSWVQAKECALIAAKEVRYTHYDSITVMWWDDVIKEIEKL